jgi:hypothetical protein
LDSRKYKLTDGDCTVSVVRHGAGVGALARFRKPDYKRSSFTLPRDFGALGFNRSFEQDRLLLAPQQREQTIKATDPEKLKNVKQPLPGLKLGSVAFQQLAKYNLLASVTFTYPMDSNGVPPLQSFLLPLWAQAGPPEIRGETDPSGDHLMLSWSDPETEYHLGLPCENAVPVVLQVSDRQGNQNLNERIAEALKFDNHERSERLAAGKPDERLPRQIEMFDLGMSKAQVMSLIPAGKTVLKRDMPDGIVITLAGEPAPNEAHVPRQIFVRFGEGDKVTEIRARYEPGPAAKNSWAKDIVTDWNKRAGAALMLPAPWKELWGGEKVSKTRADEYFWKDDHTLATLQTDGSGAELRVRDCPADQPNGIPMAPLEYLSRGPDGIALDTPRDQIVSHWTGSKPGSTPDGGLLLMPASGPYDAILVYFDDKGKAARIVARHKATAGKKRTSPQDWAQGVQEVWGGSLPSLGWWRRQELTAKDVLQALGWHDDRTQIRAFWLEDGKGATALYTEWMHVPIP